MPYAINDGAIIQVVVRYETDLQVNLNTLTYKYNGEGVSIVNGAEYIRKLAEAMANDGLPTSLYSVLRPVLGNDVQMVYVQAQVIAPVRYGFYRQVNRINGGGVVGSEPSGCAASITRRIEIAERGRTGRIQVGGVPANFVSASVLNAGGLASYEQLRLFLTLPFASADGTGANRVILPVLFRRINLLLSPPITGAEIQPTLRYMTRRTVGRGI